jgi:hypothetical protein
MNPNRVIMARLTPLKEMDRSFDVEFWQRKGTEAIFEAAWEMVVEAWKIKGRDESELKFQRTVGGFRPLRG